MDDSYDEACDTINDIKRELEAYKEECCSTVLRGARSSWTYINTKEASKDKYLIELPSSFYVPHEFLVKSKRGSGAKQVNKYQTPVVEQLVQDLDRAIDVKCAGTAGKAAGMKIVFAKFAEYAKCMDGSSTGKCDVGCTRVVGSDSCPTWIL